MIKVGVNPLNVFGLRETNHIPPHFEKVFFNLHTEEKIIRDWVYENLEGRFCLTQLYNPENRPASKLNLQHCIGFEIHSEASMFAIQLDQINRRSNELF